MTDTEGARRVTGEDRRGAIAAAARALLVEKGFEGLRTRDIAGRVGINVATLHYHVPSKEALIDLVAESARAEFASQHQAVRREGLDPLQRLRLEFADFLDTIENRHELMAVMCEFDQRARRDLRVRAAFDRLRGVWLGHLVNILALGVRDGSFRPDLDPATAGAMIIATLTGLSRIPGTGPHVIRAVCAELERSVRNPRTPTQQG